MSVVHLQRTPKGTGNSAVARLGAVASAPPYSICGTRNKPCTYDWKEVTCKRCLRVGGYPHTPRNDEEIVFYREHRQCSHCQRWVEFDDIAMQDICRECFNNIDADA